MPEWVTGVPTHFPSILGATGQGQSPLWATIRSILPYKKDTIFSLCQGHNGKGWEAQLKFCLTKRFTLFQRYWLLLKFPKGVLLLFWFGFGVFLNKFIYLIYLILAALGLHCWPRASSSWDERGLLFIVVCGFFIAVASLVTEHRL